MSDQERLDVLRSVDELASVSGPALRSLLRFFDEVQVPAGVAVAVEGRLCHEFLVVATGAVEVCRRGVASYLGRGDSFGWREMRDRDRYDASLLTLAPTRLLVMGHSQFRAAEGLVTSSTVRCGLLPATAKQPANAHSLKSRPQNQADSPRALPPPPTGPSPADAPDPTLAAKNPHANVAC